MVFPHTKFPSTYENSSLHISAIEGKSNLSLLKDCKPGMKRTLQSDAVFGSSVEKRKRFNSTPFFMKEEISEADFQMRLIKQSLAMKKDWVYQQVLEKLGVKPPSGHVMRKSEGIVCRTKAERSKHMSQYGHNSSILLRSRDGNKVHDEEGNCYIDEDDYNSFYRPKEHNNGQCKVEIASTNINHNKFTAKRNLNFTYHGTNGGVAIDHETLPKVIGIHSVPRKGNPEKLQRSHPKHIAATLVGSSYKTMGKLSPVENCPLKDEKWWPPSPESIPDETSREGEGLLKVMTPDDMKAYGLPKQEDTKASQDDDVFVTKVLQRGIDNVSPTVPKADIHGMPPLQLDADGKPSNYKEILFHYIAQQVKNNPQNPSLTKITNNAMAGRQKTMNMDELCKKLVHTREKLEREQMKWKRKLLYSLEVVLIKKIRKLEQETEEMVPEEINLEGPTKSEQSSGSQSDIVAVMEDLTNDVSVPRARKISETTTTRRSVSVIRGYESS